MSIQRYDVHEYGITPHFLGDWVKFSGVETLEKENAKLSKALEHISTMCGNPSAVDACRLIANKCQEVLNEHRN